jgi:hypothetical protein
MRHHFLAALLGLAVCASLAAPTRAAVEPFAAWKEAVCRETPSPGPVVASTDEYLVKAQADSTAGTKYLVMYTPGAGCMLFYVNWTGSVSNGAPVLVGTSQIAAVVGSAYTCTFFKNSAVPLPAKLIADTGAAFPTSFAAVKPIVRCSFFLYNTSSSEWPVDAVDDSAGNYGAFVW